MADVCVVGAGPSGLLMAAEIMRHGLTCRIIDKAPSPSDKSKALAIQARTLEVLYHIGLADTCIEQGLKIGSFIPMSGGKKIAEIAFNLIDSPFPFVLSLEQSRFEHILIEHLAKFGCQVEREVECLSFTQNDTSVTLSLLNHVTGALEEVTTSWLIGCDGAHSSIRKQLHLRFEGKSFPEIISLADVDVDWKYAHNQGRAFIDKRGLLAAIPIRGENRYRFVFKLNRAKRFQREHPPLQHGEISPDLLQPPTREEVTLLIQERGDPNAEIQNTYWLANFHINSRMVDRFREDHVFLVGDSAHIHSPVGGQGMNTGLQDAFNLAWKLALVHKNMAQPALLNSYSLERHHVGKNLLHGTEVATSIILLQSPFLIGLRNILMRIAGLFPFVRKKIASTLAQISIRYPLSPWTVQKKTDFSTHLRGNAST